MIGQRGDPLLHEQRAVDLLVALDSGGRVGAVGDALVVHHHRGRLDDRAVTRRPDRERQVGVFVVGGRVALVESTDGVEQVLAHQDRRSGAVVDVAPHLELRGAGVPVAPVVPAGAVGPDDAATFL
jgi:hypothetical protein